MASYSLYNDDCLNVLKGIGDDSVDSVITDPPYELGFLGKLWDQSGIAYNVDFWSEVLRVLKPGGHLLSFSGSRTYHRMVCAIEDAGFEIRDQIMWVYGSGFPKSLDVSKSIAKRAGGALLAKEAIKFMKARREELGLTRIQFEKRIFGRADGNVRNWEDGISIPKPGIWTDIRRAMQLDSTPYDDAMERGDEEVGVEAGSFGYQANGERWSSDRVLRKPISEIARQWSGWGTALKPAHEPICIARKPLIGTIAENVLTYGTGAINIEGCKISPDNRWPANFIHDGSDEVLFLSGDQARFFYCAKASKKDRNEGLIENNNHPTVKPTELMRYLCRLVTPTKGTVLDPFMGSGTTGKAAALEGFSFIGIEMMKDYFEVAETRIQKTYDEKSSTLTEFLS